MQSQNLGVKKEESAGFKQANNSDSDFEFLDDQIDEDEEFGGASRSVKLSIRALNFNAMISDQRFQSDPTTHSSQGRASLLSRASSLVAQNTQQKKGNSRPSAVAQGLDRNSKLLQLYLQPQMTSNRDSCFYMAGIDEREEYDEDGNSIYNVKDTNSTRPSNVAKKYNFASHYTPSQSSKRMHALETNYSNRKLQQPGPGNFNTHQQSRSANPSYGGRKIDLTSTQKNRNLTKQQFDVQQLDHSVIPERDNEDSQAVDDDVASSAFNAEDSETHNKQLVGEVSGRFSQKLSILEKDDEFGSSVMDPCDEGYSQRQQTEDDQAAGRSSMPSKQLNHQHQNYHAGSMVVQSTTNQVQGTNQAHAHHHTKHSSKYSSNGLPTNVPQAHVTQSVQNMGKIYQNTDT